MDLQLLTQRSSVVHQPTIVGGWKSNERKTSSKGGETQ
jgi:hypothetical protein